MRRGTTPLHTFHTDTDLTDATVLYLTYKQAGKTVVEKSKDDLTIREDAVEVKLSQTDTLSFILGARVRIQIRAGFADGSRIASNIIETTAEEILKDGEI